MRTMVHRGDIYEVVETYPLGYEIWNIGDNAPDGYIPFCRLKLVQPFEGAREIERDTLKLMKCAGARAIMSAARCGLTTLPKMEAYLKKNQYAPKGSYEANLCRRIKLALPYMLELTTRI